MLHSYDPSGHEIVPSSNPSSQESIDEEILHKLDTQILQRKNNITHEIFEKVDSIQWEKNEDNHSKLTVFFLFCLTIFIYRFIDNVLYFISKV